MTRKGVALESWPKWATDSALAQSALPRARTLADDPCLSTPLREAAGDARTAPRQEIKLARASSLEGHWRGKTPPTPGLQSLSAAYRQHLPSLVGRRP